MGDLISRSALIENIDNDIKMTEQFMNSEMDTKRYSQLFTQLNTLKSYKGIIEEMPTAYDVEKVVAELEEERGISYVDFDEYAYRYELDLTDNDDWFCKGLARAIDIVKRGGVE